MNGAATRQERLGDGDADGAADVAHEVEDAAGVAELLVVQGPVSCDVDRDEDEGEAEASDEDGGQEGGGGDVQRDVAEVESCEAEGDEADGEEVTRVDLVGEVADERQAADGADAAGRDHQASGEGGVSEQFLIEEGQDDDGGVDGD